MKKSSLLICMFLCSIVCAAENVKLLLPERIYAVPGVEINVYFQNIVTVINPDNYVFDVDCKKAVMTLNGGASLRLQRMSEIINGKSA